MKKQSKDLTDIGFKRRTNRVFDLLPGYVREFKRCPKCKQRYFFDYIPYSLSNPIITVPCNHDFKKLITF